MTALAGAVADLKTALPAPDTESRGARGGNSPTLTSPACPATPPVFLPGDRQLLAFGYWQPTHTGSKPRQWRQERQGGTPVAVVAELARHWMSRALYTKAPEEFYGNPEWTNDGEIPCIPQGYDGLDHLTQFILDLPAAEGIPVIFAVDIPGGAARALTAALMQAGCRADIAFISMCRSRDTRYGRADALVIDAARQWGSSAIQEANTLTYATPWLTILGAPQGMK